MKNKSKIVCFDFDGVVTDGNPLYHLISFSKLNLGELKLGLELLEDSRNPKSFFKAVKELVKSGKGMEFDAIERTVLKTKLMKGCAETFEELGKSGNRIVVASINDGRIIKKFLEKHGLDKYVSHIYASRLGVSSGRLTGIISGDVIKTEKTGVVKKLRGKSGITYVGDGLTDLPVMKKAGKSILFCPNELTKAEVFADKELMKMEKEGRLFLVEKKDLREVLRFI